MVTSDAAHGEGARWVVEDQNMYESSSMRYIQLNYNYKRQVINSEKTNSRQLLRDYTIHVQGGGGEREREEGMYIW